jgi:hypothetical protein
LSRHYRPPALATGGSAGAITRPGSSADGSTHPHQAVAVAPARLATSARAGQALPPATGTNLRDREEREYGIRGVVRLSAVGPKVRRRVGGGVGRRDRKGKNKVVVGPATWSRK